MAPASTRNSESAGPGELCGVDDHPGRGPADAELRRNAISGKWAVVVPERGARPSDLDGGTAVCPFCPGNESLTPPEVDALRAPRSAPNAAGWRVRVVPNKYAAFSGRHDVIVHSPDHDLAFEDLSPAQAADVVTMYQRRVDAHLRAGATAVTVIANRGSLAGASLSHPHSQVFATPMVPPLLAAELAAFARHERETDACLLCDSLRETVADGSQVIFDGAVVAWTPAASRFAYETWLAPQAHSGDFREADATAVAGALQRALAAVATATGGAPLNYWLHTAPADCHECFHWHIEIAPRLTTLAGFELGTDMTIAIIDPRVAAQRLRVAAAAAAAAAAVEIR